MIHPATELRFVNPEIGLGVFAREAIPKGTIVWTLCRLDIVLTPHEAAALPAPYQPVLDRYAYTDWEGRVVLCWDHGRYINHSCDPVMVGIGNEIEIAVRDIAAGDQLTCEYATLYPTVPMECRCGSSGCRGGVGPDDLVALWSELDRKGAAALTSARSVPQPLLPFVRDTRRFLDWVDGRADPPSFGTVARQGSYARSELDDRRRREGEEVQRPPGGYSA
jgi:uncharacterized protein